MNLQNISNEIINKKSENWKKSGEVFALNLFHKAAKEVPAYKDFLNKNKIKTDLINTFSDLENVPYTDKKNYIDNYTLKELSWGGELPSKHVLTSSSGSTGNSYFWPSSEDEFIEGAYIHEYIFNNNFHTHKHTTLVIVCFGMGTWVAGLYTFLSTFLIKNSGNIMGVMTPGFNKKEALRILNEVSPLYDQTIIAGYPTFVKDLVGEYSHQKKRNKTTKLKFLFAGEGFTESWRDYVLNMAGEHTLKDSVSILGSADASLMGFETMESIEIRRWAQENREFSQNFFKDERIPSLQNYIPTFRFFQSHKQELLLTADRVIPFVRYNIHDIGDIVTFNEGKAICEKYGYYLSNNCHELPFVYVFGRGKYTATIYAANIYPENIRDVLFDKNINSFITGRFLIETKYTETHGQYLDLKVELAEGVKNTSKIQNLIVHTFISVVTKRNSEYQKIFQEYGASVEPKVTLYPYKDPLYFPDEKINKTG